MFDVNENPEIILLNLEIPVNFAHCFLKKYEKHFRLAVGGLNIGF